MTRGNLRMVPSSHRASSLRQADYSKDEKERVKSCQAGMSHRFKYRPKRYHSRIAVRLTFRAAGGVSRMLDPR